MNDYGYDNDYRRRTGWGAAYGYGGAVEPRIDREGRDWSRPELNASMGAAERARMTAYDYGWYRGSAATPRLDSWRTGEPWGSGRAAADEVRARDLMTENPEAVTPQTSLVEVAKRMRDLDVGIIPVVADPDSSMLKGVITDRDITIRAAAEGKDMKKTTAGDVMSSNISSVHEGSSIRDVFTIMKRERVRRVPVTDGSGRLIGIIAQADLAVDYAGMDTEREIEVEEVVERISEPARPRAAGGWRTPGWADTRGPYHASAERYDRELRDRVRSGWTHLKREARDLFDRGYRRGYDREWW